MISATGFIGLSNRAFVAHIGYLFVEQHTVCHRVPHTPLLNHIPILASILKLYRQLYNQLISVVVVLDNLALTSKKIGTTEFFYQIIVFVKLKIKFSVKSSV